MNNPKNAAVQKERLRRFYDDVAIIEGTSGWQVLLDDAPIRTPAGEVFEVPTQALAEAVATEWAGQQEFVELDSMYHMQFSCAALDYTRGFRQDVERETRDYITTDLLCYRAQEPQGLVQYQTEKWNPWIEWAEQRFDIKLVLVAGIMPAQQSDKTFEIMHAEIAKFDDFALTAMWLLAKHTGSLVVPFAVWERAMEPEEAFAISRIEENYQNEQWGTDEEAQKNREAVANEMRALGEFIALIQ